MEAMTVHRYTKPSYLACSKFLPHAHRAFFCVLSSYIIIIIMLFSCVCSQSCDWCEYTKKKCSHLKWSMSLLILPLSPNINIPVSVKHQIILAYKICNAGIRSNSLFLTSSARISLFCRCRCIALVSY